MPLDTHSLQPIGFRPAAETDIDFLYALHVATMKEYVDKTWGWDDAFQRSAFWKNFIPDDVQIITHAGNDIGMLSFVEREDDVFLRSIEIHPAHQQRGIGTRTIQQIVHDAALKSKPTSLRVLKVNPAMRLYERLGFLEIEETQTHFIMKTRLPE